MPGALNAGTLSRAFSRAMLDYVIEWSNHERSLAGSKGKEASNDLGLTTLLVGTGAGGVSVPDSVHATLQSVVRTNQALAAARERQAQGFPFHTANGRVLDAIGMDVRVLSVATGEVLAGPAERRLDRVTSIPKATPQTARARTAR